jgi:mannan endo-1,4-beta-mannosidase
MRHLALNLLTLSATAALLVALALPAREILRAPGGDAAAPAQLPPTPPAQPARRAFGVFVDPWHVDDWARDVGAMPQLVGKFEAFSRKRPLDPFLDEAHRQGIRQLLLSWEPWRPVPVARGLAVGSLPQVGYRSGDIAGGLQDEYIRRTARSLARFPGTVWLRYAHEMNGYWYPWSRGPVAYRRAWRRVVALFRIEGADNVRFVFSVNANLFEPRRTWWRGVRAYWPGRRWVDAVGTTMIDFGRSKDYTVDRFAPRIRELRRRTGLPVVLTEVNVDHAARLPWLRNLRAMLAGMPWIRAIVWSQLPSRGRAHQSGTGDVDWDVRRDPASRTLLRAIVEDGSRPPGH